MAATNRSLFSWHDLDTLPDLRWLALVIAALPDEAIVAALEQKRGREWATTASLGPFHGVVPPSWADRLRSRVP